MVKIALGDRYGQILTIFVTIQILEQSILTHSKHDFCPGFDSIAAGNLIGTINALLYWASGR